MALPVPRSTKQPRETLKSRIQGPQYLISMPYHLRHHHSSKRRGTAIGLATQRSARISRLQKHPRRFVMQTHALGAPRARPSALLIVGVAVVVLYVVAQRLRR